MDSLFIRSAPKPRVSIVRHGTKQEHYATITNERSEVESSAANSLYKRKSHWDRTKPTGNEKMEPNRTIVISATTARASHADLA